MSNMNRDNNRAVWFDIPVADLERAVTFYKEVLAIKVDIESFDDCRFAVLEHEDGNGGCLVENSDEISSDKGILIYMNVHGRIQDATTKVTANGGTIQQPVHPIGPHGFRAVVLDSEGNRIALHSETDG
ncbi:MAG: VOC family protein [Planctomicrobium sp.]|jgi:uncharacterized protein|nr:VOC family protein [Planctomicrobium sp.]